MKILMSADDWLELHTWSKVVGTDNLHLGGPRDGDQERGDGPDGLVVQVRDNLLMARVADSTKGLSAYITTPLAKVEEPKR